ncbi:unnamed protein product [Cylicostephanus goldi]|uniref:Uncharacterized protein n=1 Tax=Cylicostephanus goldi TaxID=71465 RepID=A0A3P6SUY1_CYLGO|nr:unnamed protein product [Cylicostephanus goldi]
MKIAQERLGVEPVSRSITLKFTKLIRLLLCVSAGSKMLNV